MKYRSEDCYDEESFPTETNQPRWLERLFEKEIKIKTKGEKKPKKKR
ncbi:MAG: hypothetical protein GX864_03820 [Mollicutes bacterium]|jgi:hypothetical protein|nr:hypothetical protein [Mollicutes bacterium]